MNRSFLRHLCWVILGFASVLNCSSLYPQQLDSTKIIVIKNAAASKYVSAVMINRVRYISLPDLVRMFGLKYSYNPVLRKMEITLSRAEMKLAADNAFLVVTDFATRKETPLQMPVPARSLGDSLFAPLMYFLPIFNSISQTELAIDTARERSLAGLDSTGQPRQYDVASVGVEARRNGYLLRIHSKKQITDADKFERDDGWLYVTLPNATVDTLALDAIQPTPLFDRVLAVQSPTSAQIAFKLTKKVATSEILSDSGSDDVLISLHTSSPVPRREIAAERRLKEEDEQKRQEELQSQLEAQRKKWKLDVVVLDAGHGGNDPGTLGTIGTREKDITLGIVLKLGKLIEEQLPEVKVVYTRKTDRFVELYRRGQIANENQGKLFISIHCNSLERKPSPTNGFEIYLLRPGKTEDAVKIAEKENAVVRLEKDYQDRYKGLTEENFIIVNMAQSAYVRQSEQFAADLEQEMGKKMTSASHGVKQAGFYVLVGASMPNVLIETGYLSNRHDEMFLRSPSGQQIVAESILEALKRYKASYERTLKEGS
ncbi:MAG TPA: N-acetylmuramoyl-L-alanine amidase [Bacteroidota bacterium]|nr:N-acetylmuramoyl-L-alanine amidase [Bacteroidota bacterium]